MSQIITVTVENDYLEALATPSRTLTGVAELIWNALDAEATSVKIRLTESELGALSSIEIIDDGHGMSHSDVFKEFAHLGGSWKLYATHSKNRKRILHGKRGQGRWRAFSVGSRVTWTTVAETAAGREQTTIVGRRDALTRFEVSEPEPTSAVTGTRVLIENVNPEPTSVLLGDDADEKLIAILALYLQRYPEVGVDFRGIPLDPGRLQLHRNDYDLGFGDDLGTAVLTVIEWSKRFPRELLLCDENGIALQAQSPGVQAPQFDFTAYLKWHGFRERETQLAVADLDPVVSRVVDAGRARLREHFQNRSTELRARVIQEWKREEVYPYKGEASGLELVERELFDVVAVTAASAVNSADRKGRRFSLELLRQAIEQSPSSLRHVLHEVLELPKDKLVELDALLQQTSLTSIIALGKVVADRLDFLMGLREMVFDPQSKQAVLERSQLHRILAGEPWVFGDEYTLAVDDESLKAVLEKHVAFLDREKTAADLDPVRLEDGSQAIVDLMFAATIPLATQQHEHIVVELKRPSLHLGYKELTQIQRYATAVAEDERFDTLNVQWNFWLVGTSMDSFVRAQARQLDTPVGVVSRPLQGRVTVWAKTWSEIIDDCQQRLKFVEEKLAYKSTRDAGVEYLRREHDRFLPDILRDQSSEQDAAVTDPASDLSRQSS